MPLPGVLPARRLLGKERMNKKGKGILCAVLSAVAFGCNPLMARTVYAGGGNATTLTLCRLVFGSVLFGLLCCLRGVSLRITRRECRDLAICAIGFSATPILLLSSYHYLPSGLATTIHFVYPTLVLAGCVLFRHEKLTLRKVVCCILCTVGVISFYTPGGSIRLVGILIAFASGATYAFYTVYLAGSCLLEMDAYKLACWTGVFSSVITFAAALCLGQFAFPDTALAWSVTGIFCVVICFASLLYQLGTKYAGAQSTALFSTFEPLTSVMIGALVYHESMNLRAAAGIFCILLGTCLLALDKDRTAQCPPDSQHGRSLENAKN